MFDGCRERLKSPCAGLAGGRITPESRGRSMARLREMPWGKEYDANFGNRTEAREGP